MAYQNPSQNLNQTFSYQRDNLSLNHSYAKNLLALITSHIKSDKFPSQELTAHPSKKGTSLENFDSLYSKSTKDSLIKSQELALERNLSNNQTSNILHPIFEVPQKPQTKLKRCRNFEDLDLSDPFNQHDDCFLEDEVFLANNRDEENSSLENYPKNAVSISEEDFIQHKKSQETFEEAGAREISPQEFSSFIGQAAELLADFLRNFNNRDAFQGSSHLFSWLKKEFLDSLRSANRDEILAFLQLITSKYKEIVNHQTLFTYLTAHPSPAFPVFSFNLLRFLDVHNNSLSLQEFYSFSFCLEKHRLKEWIPQFSMVIGTIFKAQVYDSLDNFIFRLNMLESLPTFRHHRGIRRLLQKLLSLLQGLKKTYRNLPLKVREDGFLYLNSYTGRKLSQMTLEVGKQELCKLLEDSVVFMKEIEWLFLVDLEAGEKEVIENGFQEAYKLILNSLANIGKLIEEKVI